MNTTTHKAIELTEDILEAMTAPGADLAAIFEAAPAVAHIEVTEEDAGEAPRTCYRPRCEAPHWDKDDNGAGTPICEYHCELESADFEAEEETYWDHAGSLIIDY